MGKILMIPILAVGLVGATAETSEARERGLSTFSGQRSSIDYSSAIASRSAGERCKVTMCGRAVSANDVATRGYAESTDIVGDRSSARSRLGAAQCNSTFCGRR